MPVKPDGTINLHGREYKTVALRVAEFRASHPASDGWAILTTILDATDDRVTMRAEIVDPTGRIVATGHAEERRESGRSVNATSALENGETSAVGRALAAFGLGGTEYASADEVANAIRQQQPDPRKEPKQWTDKQRAAYFAKIGELGVDHEALSEWCISVRRPKPSAMTPEQRGKLIAHLESPAGQQLIANLAGGKA